MSRKGDWEGGTIDTHCMSDIRHNWTREEIIGIYNNSNILKIL